MPNTLVDPTDIMDFPGGPFEDQVVDAAVASVRAEAGWHIAPQVTQTLTVDSYGGTLLILPSRRIVAVTAVRNVTTGSETLGNWTRMSGGIYRRTGWPIGVLEVDLTHGYATTPEDLLPAVAARAVRLMTPRDPELASRTVGQVAETYRAGDGSTPTDPVIARYAVVAGVA